MKHLVLMIIAVSAFNSNGFSHSGKIKMHGKLQVGELTNNHHNIKNLDPVREVIISVFENEKKIKSFNTLNKHNYEIHLYSDKSYKIQFKKEGYVTKVIEIVTLGMSEDFLSRGYNLFTDITLFKNNSSPEIASYSEVPVAICRYNKKKNILAWDMRYALDSHRTFVSLMKKASNELLATEETLEEDINYQDELESIDMMDEHLELIPTKRRIPLFKSKNKLNEPLKAHASSK